MRRPGRLAAVAGFFLLVSAPLLVQSSGLEHDDGGWENRILAPAPAWPRRLADLATDLATLPRVAGAWLDDHFGLRRPLVQLANHLRFAVFAESGNPQIAFGRHRQLFLTSHDAAHPQEMLLFLCRGGDAGPILARSLARFLDAALRRNPRAVELLVPTKTVIDAADLPGWMRARCAGGTPVLPAMLAALAAQRPDLRAHVVYPLALMRGLHGADAPYPKFNFHWDGSALQAIAAGIAADRFGRPRLAPLPLRAVTKSSDIAHLLPGVPLRFRTIEPDLAAADVTAALRIPELGASGGILYDVSHFTRRGRVGPRLLILSDSFGQAVAPWFAAYYGEVWHVAVNNIAQLTPERQAALTDTLFDRFRPDDLLLVFHDFSQGYVNQQLMRPLWHQADGAAPP